MRDLDCQPGLKLWEAAGLLDEDGVGRFRFNGGSVGAADSRSCFGSMLDSGITTDAGVLVRLLVRELQWGSVLIRPLW